MTALSLLAATASAGYFGIHEGARLPKAYAALVTGGMLVGAGGATSGGGAGTVGFVGARMTILEGLMFVSRRWAIGVTTLDVTRDARDFVTDVSGGWVTGTIGYLTMTRGRHFDFVSLQLGILPVRSANLYYTAVPFAPWPAELFARAGFIVAVDENRAPSGLLGHVAVGARVGLGMWVMREPDGRSLSGFRG
jgi:hypothetical protein